MFLRRLVLWRLLLLLLLAAVTVAASVTQCSSEEYEAKSSQLCCKLCPAGHHVSAHCTENHGSGECSPCKPNTFMAHRTGRTSCMPCAHCRDDQEVVKECSPFSDRQCQCREGIFYCDSMDCVESCFRCTRCKGAILHPCNATRDTVCATDTNQEPGNSNWYWFFIVVGVVIVIPVYYLKKKGVQILPWFVSILKQESNEPGSPSPERSQPNDMLLMDPERDRPAPGVETTQELEEERLALAPGAGTCPGPSEHPEEGIELQVVVATAAPEQELQSHVPAACGPQGQAETAPSLRRLEQEYKQKYFLKDTSSDFSSLTCLAFEREVPPNDWKMFMRLIGLEENDIEICKYENPGNLMEERHKMLLMWRNKLGREASIFRLLAALYTLGLHECLQNIINRLVAENILGRHADTPN
ncbi:tumor necrosis factor receptor superfamily member 10B-like isoform X2 [Diceros bicornis minor]|uniref:tumor necrosis factor receptor superfamily member 10B-like isoform X2 n=1 Tax=Diceros bicornis minor TaxID=77932 RepID=UPI0026EE96E1|nr:tumor necrosis factor receptor superfamily member 10B-like isoform X2 [Diceros bicornis minor]